MDSIYLRKASDQDVNILYKWANDEVVRKNSFNSNYISLTTHKKWFFDRLYSKACDIFLFFIKDTPIGQVRLDYEDNIAHIDYSIDKKYRGQGYGLHMMTLLEQRLAKEKPGIGLSAKVKIENIASQHIFEKLQYEEVNQGDKEKEIIIYYKKKLNSNNRNISYTIIPPPEIYNADQ